MTIQSPSVHMLRTAVPMGAAMGAKGNGEGTTCSPSSTMDALPSEPIPVALPTPLLVVPETAIRKPLLSRSRLLALALLPVLVAMLMSWGLREAPLEAHMPPCVPSHPPAGVTARCLDESRRFPLVISPNDAAGASLEALAEWVETHG